MIQITLKTDGTVVMWDHVAIVFFTLWTWVISVPPSDGAWGGEGWWRVPVMSYAFKPFNKRFNNYFTVR